MRKSNRQTFTCVGINSTISIIKSKRFQIEKISIIRNSQAEKNQSLNKVLKIVEPNLIRKVNDKKLPSRFKTQGVAITFSGDLILDENADYPNEESSCLLVLDQVEDPQNFGQIIRTVECAGIKGIIYSKHHSVSLTETALQVSQGAFVNMKFFEVTNIRNELKKLKENNFWVVGLENSVNASLWHSIDYSDKIVIVVGSEGNGVRKKVLETCDFIATIPMQGITNSLNVSAATSVIAFEILRQRLEKK